MVSRFVAVGLVWAMAVTIGVSRASKATTDSECSRDPSSYQCLIERDRSDTERAAHERIDKDSSDTKTLAVMVNRLEDLCNTWCCSVTGVPLYETPGDKDVLNFALTMLSQALNRNGQNYGSEILTAYLTSRTEAQPHQCSAAPLGDATHFNDMMEAVVQLKDQFSAWLRTNEVDPTEIVASAIPQIRTLLGRWGVARLLVSKSAGRVAPEAAVLSLLPLLDGDDDSAEERCTAAGQLYVTYREAGVDTATTMPRLHVEIRRLLDECFENGRVSAEPAAFGETLLDADREPQARELFDLAVQRGRLCNPYQRPDMLFRKDLSAQPVWSLDSFPPAVLRGFLSVQDGLAEAVQEPVANSRPFVFSNDTETMSGFTATGYWERTIIYAAHTWHDYNCRQFGNETCARLKRLAETLLDTNDAYGTQCNGSLSFGIWRLSSNFSTHRTVGNSNIVLQLLMPLRSNGNTLLLNVGEEAIKIDQGDIIVVDDSFENVLKVVPETSPEEPSGSGGAPTEDTGIGASEDGAPPQYAVGSSPMILFHAQLCHPEFHDRALELPGKKCRSAGLRS